MLMMKKLYLRRVYLPLLFFGLCGVTACSSGPGMQLRNTQPEPTTQAVPLKFVSITPDLISKLKAQTVQDQLAEQQQLRKLAQYSPGPYQVGISDQLGIVVWGSTELNNPMGASVASTSPHYTVEDDGSIFYPYVGKIHVANKTVAQIRNTLTKRFAEIIKKPQVSIEVATFNSQYVNVVGEVNTPNILPLTNVRLSTGDAINKVGGANKNGDLAHGLLRRNGVAYRLDLKNDTVAQHLYLKPADVLAVPNFDNFKVYALGEVKAPGSIILRTPSTLAEVLSEAQGLNQTTSNSEQIFVLRNTANGPIAYQLAAKDAGQLLLAQQFSIEANDIIYVGTYQPTALYRIFSQFLPLTTNMYNLTMSTRAVQALHNDNWR
jgi:polysaccharide export outer membrane protein